MSRDTINAVCCQFKEESEEEHAAIKGSEKSPEQVMMTVEAGASSTMLDLTDYASTDDTNTCSSQNLDVSSRSKGKRTIESMNERKMIEAMEVVKAKNEIPARMENVTSEDRIFE